VIGLRANRICSMTQRQARRTTRAGGAAVENEHIAVCQDWRQIG
jgi:hypothetical protein